MTKLRKKNFICTKDLEKIIIERMKIKIKIKRKFEGNNFFLLES